MQKGNQVIKKDKFFSPSLFTMGFEAHHCFFVRAMTAQFIQVL